MRILCDQNVPEKYLQALRDAAGVRARRVDDVLTHDATDDEIASYAAAHGWVVFTNDADFYAVGGNHGLLVYAQIEDPAPGDVVQSVRRIDDAYESAADVLETVPDGWV